MRGFFQESTLIGKAPKSRLPYCAKCKLYKHCQTPKMDAQGQGGRGIMLIGEAPGETEDEQGKQFLGKSGQYLSKVLRENGVKMRRDCLMHNALSCRPTNNSGDNRKPTPDEVNHCRPRVLKEIEQHKPQVIVLMGGGAISSVIGHYWKEDPGPVKRWAGECIPSVDLNAWLCPVAHPSSVMREENQHENPIPIRLFEKHIKAAVEAAAATPWDPVPDYESQVECIEDPSKAARRLRQFAEDGGPIAFDYETNCLKPEYKGAAIASASVCLRGRDTIAFPWWGKAVRAMRGLLLDTPCPKIAHNMKYEERWTAYEFGRGVLNWYWDPMQAAHIDNNTPGTTGLKYQAFCKLGVGSYDDNIKSLLKSAKGKKLNKVLQEIDLPQLLLYNGLDSLLTYKLAELQTRHMFPKRHEVIYDAQ